MGWRDRRYVLAAEGDGEHVLAEIKRRRGQPDGERPAFGGANYFGVSGKSVSSSCAGHAFSAGQAVTVNGAGAGAVTVGVFYAGTLSDAQNKNRHDRLDRCGRGGGQRYVYHPWTVPDWIGNTVYLRVENTANTAVNVAGPYTITGKLTITNPTVTNWVVGTPLNIRGP